MLPNLEEKFELEKGFRSVANGLNIVCFCLQRLLFGVIRTFFGAESDEFVQQNRKAKLKRTL